MKIDAMPSIVQMEPEVLNNLVREVKETLATNIQLPGEKRRLFTIADLWNIRRNARTAQDRFNR
ncbi:MAG: hypothetical protein H7Y01_02210 [Ferruginibacter sp.]|nr:hypothetical protein [Chitinophagaceae bacterium]